MEERRILVWSSQETIFPLKILLLWVGETALALQVTSMDSIPDIIFGVTTKFDSWILPRVNSEYHLVWSKN